MVLDQYTRLPNATARARDLLDDVTDPDAAMTNHSLDCGAIRREFGIQQLPWRGFVDRAVTRYLELYVKSDKDKETA